MKEEEKIWNLLEMCFYGYIEKVKEILSEGIDINCVGRNGQTPIMAAKDGENNDIIELLLSLGAIDKPTPQDL